MVHPLKPSSLRPEIIKNVECFSIPPRWIFVRIEASNGMVGWGEATLEGHTPAVLGALSSLSSQFINWPIDNIEDIWQTATRGGFYRGGPVLMSALSGIDIALWDLKGKILGVPVWSLLGGKVREKVKIYGWIGGNEPKDVLNAAQERKKEGFTSVKMNGTSSIGWLDSPSMLDEVAQRLKDVKSIGIDAGIDFHGRVHAPMARQLAQILAEHRPLFIEEPLLPGVTHIEALKSLRSLVSTPIALGERLHTRQDFIPYLTSACVDIIQPDISHVGGISELRRLASLAETFDVSLAPHCPNGPIALAASIAVDANAMNFAIQEMSLGIHYNVGADLFTYIKNPEIFSISSGYITVPDLPGLGLEINEDVVRNAAASFAQEPEWKTPIWRSEENGEIREW